MEALMRSKALNDDAAAALRRAFAFAGLFGMAGLASIACTARVPDRVAIQGTDRLMAEEARLAALANGSETIAFPQTLLARRSDPHVAQSLAAAERRFTEERQAAAAQREALIRRIEDARAQRDLYEARRTVLRLKLDTALDARAAATQRHDQSTLASLAPQVRALQADVGAASEKAGIASARVNRLTGAIAAQARAFRARAATQRSAVQDRLRGG